MVDGGVGRGMGSRKKNFWWCKADAKAAKVEKMNNHNERKKMDKLILGDLKSKDPDVRASFSQHRHRDMNEVQFGAHRLLSSTVGARSGAARASRSPVRLAGPTTTTGRCKREPRSL